ncbi:MAG: primosomal protein N' [Leptothrix ochracea]|uniref:replication restart helicase PriA n=2 Tax=Leptothrix ochracea TaxID=735331 RepID=UPI0034E21117
MPTVVRVLVDLPRHSRLAAGALDYLEPPGAEPAVPLAPGTLVRVPLGRRQVCGLVWPHGEHGERSDGEAPPMDGLKAITEVLSALPPLSTAWLRLVAFAAAYYQRSPGEMALAVLPPELKDIDAAQLERRLRRLHKGLKAAAPEAAPEAAVADARPFRPDLSPEQAEVLRQLALGEPVTSLLHGVTGSGKTEIYLREAERVLAQGRQVLVLVPEINLTPQLEARFAQRFGASRLRALHSGLTPAQRLQNWLAAHLGHADLVLGTRLAIFAPLPRLGLIVVDEEHDPSYKQQEGARYSARDLAVYRGRLEGVPVLLGSATPSLETWLNAQPLGEAVQGRAQSRYRRLAMPSRIGAGALPAVKLLNLAEVVARHGRSVLYEMPIAPPLIERMKQCLARGEQSLVLLNRRGYAPVLHCTSCGWKSQCSQCSAWRVFHKIDRTLRCHHCGSVEPVMRSCPDCGDMDIQPLGRGTERLEEQLGALLPEARMARIDADTTRTRGSLEEQLAQVHDGHVDVLVGTQMVAKGHDFRRITLVIALNADAALFSQDFRAPERLFALLMQAAGRAGRDAEQAAASEMWVQTWHPSHPLYQALQRHDYVAFARSQLEERQIAGLPPYTHLALLRVEARDQASAQAFLQAATELAEGLDGTALSAGELLLYPPVPAQVQRVANVERVQMLLEASSRAVLQRFLSAWLDVLQAQRAALPKVLRWAVDVDPVSI